MTTDPAVACETIYDDLIIGTGMAGLTVGALLAQSGRKVLMLEAHDQPGGYAHTFAMGKYRFCVRLFDRYAGALEPLHVRRWPETLPIYGVGQVARVRAFWAEGQGDGGVWLCGDYLNHPWVEGSVRCGEKVAARIQTLG